MILDGALKEGEALPSVRNTAARFRVNPLTVLRSYQQLVDERLVEKRRGLNMFISAGARDTLLTEERRRFVETERTWARSVARYSGVYDALCARAAVPAEA